MYDVRRLSRQRRRTPSHTATIVRDDGLLVAVGDRDGAVGDKKLLVYELN